jgi:transcriptional regulator with XRE-family HTH domain
MISKAPSGFLAERLEHLIQTVHPKGRKPYTNVEIADAINQAAGDKVISQAYIWQLRKGVKDNPTQKHITALAAFFGVSPLYFFDNDETNEALAAEVRLALQDDAVRNVALRAAGLSDETLKTIQDLVDRARTLEGLPEINNGAGDWPPR